MLVMWRRTPEVLFLLTETHNIMANLSIKAAPHKWAIVGRGVCEVYAFRGEWHRAHPKRNKTYLGKLKGSDLFDSQADAQRELQRRKALIAEIEDLTAGGYIVYNTNKLHKESTKVLEMFLRELKS